MKRILMIVWLFFAITLGYAQNEYETQITYRPLNVVDVNNIQKFMRDIMNMHIVDYKPINKGKTILIKYGQMASYGENKNLFFKYDLFNDPRGSGTEDDIIKKLEIYGDVSFVMDFFVKFWHTTLNSDSKEQYRFYLQDKATFIFDIKSGSPRITIVNTTIKNEQEYFTKWKKILSDNFQSSSTNTGVKNKIAEDNISNMEDPPLGIVDQMPQFPEGEKEMTKFIQDNLKYPALAKEYGVQGAVLVSCIIDREGKITQIKVIRGIGSGCDEEAMRVVSKMPAWIPGKQGGKLVRVNYTIPIKFLPTL